MQISLYPKSKPDEYLIRFFAGAFMSGIGLPFLLIVTVAIIAELLEDEFDCMNFAVFCLPAIIFKLFA